ncbi:MAG: DNA polymerase/3'-5' exonuclease PolX [Nitrospirae bacterium]|nr:DNA polymerase/3'-5' exonuclease PolX [Nitrospirota bacterium]MBI3351010.1 DNA polymerase/3'-5' exonuclease PolX [Nitrospirota bacterium]
MSIKQDLGDLLNDIATYLELKGENPFKIRAYQNASRTLSLLEGDIKEMVLSGELKKQKGIGEAIFETIHEFVATEKSTLLGELKNSTPPGLLEMLNVPGLGPKKIKTIYEKLGISTLGELEYACHENRLLSLDGFGPKSQDNILKGIEQLKKGKDYFHFDKALKEAENVLSHLKEKGLFKELEIAGSLRRKKEVVKDIDIVGSSDAPVDAMIFFVHLSEVDRVIGHGETKSTVLLKSGIQVDLRIVESGEFPFAFQHFTGSKEHNTVLRGIAKDLGFKLNEYGLFKGDHRVSCKSEKEIFGHLGFDYIPPELREDRGEFEAAKNKKLPRLIDSGDIKGIFHVHTTYSDGKNSLNEMIQEAKRLGYQYVGISDHSQSAFYAHGLKETQIKEQHDEIDKLQKKNPEIKIFKGIEADILEDGALDYPEEILASFDFVIGSIHSRFKMNEEEMTRRLLHAMENPYLTILGHLTGRLLLSRPPYAFNLDAILEGARKHHIIIELNANPHRFDIDWRDCKKLKEKGLQVSINPDAHAVDNIKFTEYGVGIARKGWLTAREVFNTLPVQEMEKALKAKKSSDLRS